MFLARQKTQHPLLFFQGRPALLFLFSPHCYCEGLWALFLKLQVMQQLLHLFSLQSKLETGVLPKNLKTFQNRKSHWDQFAMCKLGDRELSYSVFIFYWGNSRSNKKFRLPYDSSERLGWPTLASHCLNWADEGLSFGNAISSDVVVSIMLRSSIHMQLPPLKEFRISQFLILCNLQEKGYEAPEKA